MFSLLRRLGDALRPRPEPISDARWQAAVAACALLQPLDGMQDRRLRELCARFLADKQFVALAGAELDEQRCLLIAAQACLPVLELDYDYLRGWYQVLVYPDEFHMRNEHHDEETGVVTDMEDSRIGEAWDYGPLVLSWADIEHDLADPHSGYNVIIHEIAHKLDMRCGAANGIPPLPPSLPRSEWKRTFQQAYEAHQSAVDAGQEALLDADAAESPDEFFAHAAEAWFSNPALVAAAMPQVAELLRRLFRPGGDPASA